jgi:hypothetical protein
MYLIINQGAGKMYEVNFSAPYTQTAVYNSEKEILSHLLIFYLEYYQNKINIFKLLDMDSCINV